MNNMPKALRKELAADPYYAVCCITREKGTRGDRIEWHHNLIHASRQYQSKFAILPVKKSIHAQASNPAIKERMDWVMLNRASTDELRTISKAIDYVRRRDYLNGKFGYPQGVDKPYPHEIPEPGIRYPWLTETEV